eukprot:scaffold7453_cov67-Phaeocystis_antarctica.AAC.2
MQTPPIGHVQQTLTWGCHQRMVDRVRLTMREKAVAMSGVATRWPIPAERRHLSWAQISLPVRRQPRRELRRSTRLPRHGTQHPGDAGTTARRGQSCGRTTTMRTDAPQLSPFSAATSRTPRTCRTAATTTTTKLAQPTLCNRLRVIMPTPLPSAVADDEHLAALAMFIKVSALVGEGLQV